MISKVMIDSSLLVEFIKGRKRQLLTQLISNSESECFINETVVSEFLFHFLHVNGEASPLSLQSSVKIGRVLSNNLAQEMLSRFLFLQTNQSIFQMVPDLMAKYNLLPNDAIILATCKIHNIAKLASHDADFIHPCIGEGIELLNEQ